MMTIIHHLITYLIILTITTTTTTAQIVTGGAGYAAKYSGVEFVALSSTCGSVNPFVTDSVTLEIWFNIAGDKTKLPSNSRTNPDANSLNAISLLGTGWEAGYELQYDYLTQKLVFQTQGPGFSDDCWVSYSKTVLPSRTTYGMWHHAAVTWNQNTTYKAMYLDGELVFNATCPGASLAISSRRFGVGGSYVQKGLSLSSGNPMFGLLDEARVWRIARTQDEIRSYMSRSLEPQHYTNLITYLTFDEGSGFLAKDVAHMENEYLALTGSMGNGKQAWAPAYVASTAPLVGSSHPTVVSIRTTPAALVSASSSFTSIPLAYQDPISRRYITTTDPVSTATITIRAISDARYLSYLRTSTGATASVVLNFSVPTLLMAPLTAILPATTQSSSSPSIAIVTIDYILTVGNQVSSLQQLILQISANTVPTIGSSGYALRCDGVDDYAIADSFRWDTSWPVTVEVWSLVTEDEVQPSALFSVGNSELVGQWCPDNPAGEPVRCQGRFMAHIPWSDGKIGWHYGWVPGVKGSVQADIVPQLGGWTHYALVSEGRLSNGTQYVYANGELVATIPADGPIGDELKGLLLCNWQYWGTLFHKGTLDNFRIWNRALTPTEIKQRMYITDDIGIGKPTPKGLMAAYDFDEDPSTPYAIDISGNGHDLIFGGCQSSETIKPPFSHSGTIHCDQPGVGKNYQNKDAFPTRLIKQDTYHGGYTFQQQLPVLSTTSGMSQFTIQLNGSDPDGQRIYATITTLPTQGILLADVDGTGAIVPVAVNQPIWQDPSSRAMSVRINVTAGSGGHPFATFSYRVSDGFLQSATSTTVTISIPCGNGTMLSNALKTCLQCPAGTYQFATSHYAESCIPVPIGSYQPSTGQSTYLNCSNGLTFSDAVGAATCKLCSEHDYSDSTCIMTADAQPQAQAAITIIAAAELILVVMALLVVVWKRHSRVIFSSSTPLTSMCLIGALGLIISVILLIRPQTPSLCMAKHWVFHLSFGLSYLALFAKTFRIDSIFNSQVLTPSKKTFKDIHLILYAIALMLWDVIILAVWSGNNPMSILSDIQRECISDHQLTYQLLLFIPKVILVLATLVLAYRVRLVPDLFNETSSLYTISFNTLVVSIIVLLLALTASMTLRSQKILMSISILWSVAILVTAFMGPKLHQLFVTRTKSTPSHSNAGLNKTGGATASHGNKSKHSDDPSNVIGGATGVSSGAGLGTGATKRKSSLGMGRHVGASQLSQFSQEGLINTVDDKHRRLQELDKSIANSKEKTAALEQHRMQVANEIHMLNMETAYRQATGVAGGTLGANIKREEASSLATPLTTPAIGTGAAHAQRKNRVGSVSTGMGLGFQSAPSPKHGNMAQDTTHKRSSDLEDVRVELAVPRTGAFATIGPDAESPAPASSSAMLSNRHDQRSSMSFATSTTSPSMHPSPNRRTSMDQESVTDQQHDAQAAGDAGAGYRQAARNQI